MRRSDEDGIRRDPIHVDTRAGLDIVHVYVAVLGDQVYYVILRRDLHSDWEVVLSFGREENVHSFLWERLVAGWCLADLCGTRILFIQVVFVGIQCDIKLMNHLRSLQTDHYQFFVVVEKKYAYVLQKERKKPVHDNNNPTNII